jgi:hypothetical protein
MAPVSAIKLIRTDTTLDLSQKAEKGMKTSSRAVLSVALVLDPLCCAGQAISRQVALNCGAAEKDQTPITQLLLATMQQKGRWAPRKDTLH